MRNLHLPGRSPVHATQGMAATSHPLATMAALDMLRDGGNAMDAAVSACAVQCVVEPQSTGIGGDCFVLLAPKGSDEVVAFNGSGRAPAAAEAQWYLDQGITEIERQSPHAVTVPGSIDAWSQLLRKHGTKSLGDVLQPAIRFARDGYPLHQRVVFDWSIEMEILTCAEWRHTFLRDGKVAPEGSLHKQPALAKTLEQIAEKGRAGFYEGKVAEAMVAYLNELGGLHSLEDFAATEGAFVTPIKTGYKGYEVYECPPNGQGIVALEILNILSGFDLADLDPSSAERLHLEIEATRLAYGDRAASLADPAQADVPVETWLSEAYAAEMRARIDPKRAMTDVPASPLPQHKDTVYLCVVDRDRNAVSFINSLFYPFGSGLMAPGTGVVLQNRGCGFVVDPGHPNCIAPRKRPLHTIIPAMLCREGKAVMPFGVMGGDYQACGHAHFVTNLIDYGMDPQAAIDQARLFPTQEGTVQMEEGVAPDVREALTALGHSPLTPEKPIGGAQAIGVDWETGVLTGGSDPRKDGCALGF